MTLILEGEIKQKLYLCYLSLDGVDNRRKILVISLTTKSHPLKEKYLVKKMKSPSANRRSEKKSANKFRKRCFPREEYWY